MAMMGDEWGLFGREPDMMSFGSPGPDAYRHDMAAQQRQDLLDTLSALYQASPIPALMRMVSDPAQSFGNMAQRGLQGHYAALSGTEAETGRPLLGMERAAELANTLPGVVPGSGMVLGAGPMVRRAGKRVAGKIDDLTGLPLNADGTVTVYHHTSQPAADMIRRTKRLVSEAEPDVYVTTRQIPDTGYGDDVVAIRVRPDDLILDDEFPGGRMDFRIDVGKPGGSKAVKLEPQE